MPQFQQVVAEQDPLGSGLRLLPWGIAPFLVPPADIGTASAAFTTMRQLDGAFGVAVLGAAFAATGGYATPAAFSHGFTTAFAVAAGLALAGTAAGTILPGRGNRPSPTVPTEPGRAVSASGTVAARHPAPRDADLR